MPRWNLTRDGAGGMLESGEDLSHEVSRALPRLAPAIRGEGARCVRWKAVLLGIATVFDAVGGGALISCRAASPAQSRGTNPRAP